MIAFVNKWCTFSSWTFILNFPNCGYFRKMAQKWHPDNFQLNENEKKIAEKKFIDIAAAKEVLTDPGNNNINFLNYLDAFHLALIHI